MKTKKVLSAALAGLLICGSLLSSCSKKESEPPKSKRTNVYSGETLNIPDTISYINYTEYHDGLLYMTYNTQYTITRNELGEEVERRVGYYWEETSFEEDLVVEEVVEEEGETDAADDGGETEDTATAETGEIGQTPATENTNKLPEGWYYDYESVRSLTVFSIEDGTYENYSLPTDIDGYAQNLFVDSTGMLDIIYNNYIWDEETMTSTNTYQLVRYDIKSGTVTETISLNELVETAGLNTDYFYVNSVYCSDSGDILLTLDDGIMILGPDFKYKSKYTIDSGWINRAFMVGDKMYVMYYPDNGDMTLKIVENGVERSIASETLQSAMSSMWEMCGIDGEKIYYRDPLGVYYYDCATDTKSEVMNYINSDILSNNISTISLLPDEKLLMVTSEYNDGNENIEAEILTRVPDEQLSEEIIVTLGSIYQNYNMQKAIIAYNKQNNGTRISYKTYYQYNNEANEWKGGVNQLNNEIITSTSPDIILLDSSLPVESYFHQGVFADLNPYIDDEECGIDRSKYLENVFEACSVDGKMYSMIMNFSLRTIMAKSEFVGNEPGWTFEEMMQCINSMPEGMTAFLEYGRDSIIDNLFANSMSSFVNWDTGETYFETQGFIDFIKYLATCPEKGYYESFYDSEHTEDEYRNMEEIYQLRYYNNTSLLYLSSISTFTDLIYTRNTFASTDVVPIGYPSENGNGATIYPNMEFAIVSSSLVKRQAWDVIKYFINDEDMANRGYYFPTNIDNLEKMAQNNKNDFYYYDNSDEDYTWYRDYGYSEEYINYLKNSNQPFDDSVIEETMKLIKGADSVVRTDDDLLDIVKEELSSFFGGTKTAEDTARVIASRAKIYISEHS